MGEHISFVYLFLTSWLGWDNVRRYGVFVCSAEQFA